MRDSIRHVLGYIEAHLGENLSSERLAREACLSTSRFHRIFKEETGTTPQKLIEQLKLTKAYALLAQGEGSVQDLAISLGYNDYETFSRAFKRQYLFSPDDLKAIAQKTKSAIDGESRLFVVTHEDFEPEGLREKILQKLKEEGIDLNEISHSHAMMIKPITLSADDEEGELIKNKFIISSGEQLWSQLIDDLKTNGKKEEDL